MTSLHLRPAQGPNLVRRSLDCVNLLPTARRSSLKQWYWTFKQTEDMLPNDRKRKKGVKDFKEKRSSPFPK
jgi:hypothetical protein